MSDKLEDLRDKYSKALRDGDTDKATDYYWKAQEVKGEGRSSGQQDELEGLEKYESLNGIGKEIAEELMEKYGSYDNFVEEADLEGLADVSGIGEARAESILEQVNE